MDETSEWPEVPESEGEVSEDRLCVLDIVP